MKKPIYLITLVIIMLSASACQQDNGANKSAPPEMQETKPINPPIYSDRIKNATLLIRIESIQPEGVSFGFGMATLVQYQGELYLITHNHYGDMLQDMNIVQLRDAENHKIRSIYASEFKRLIVFQDPGTLVLRAPDGLTDVLTAVNIDDQPQLQPGDMLQVAYRGGASRESVEIINAVIEEITVSDVTPAYRVRCLDEQALAVGDSSGGVWYGANFVGNTWSILVTQTARASSGTSEPASEMHSNLSEAAIFPGIFH